MEANNKFFSSKEIYARLASTYKNKISEYNLIDIMRWCAELVTETLRDPYGRIECNKIQIGWGPNLEVRENKVPLPPFVFKLNAVYDQNITLVKDFSYQGEYLYFPDAALPTIVYIDYETLPLDADGFPLIKRGWEQACYAYCVYKMFEEDSAMVPAKIQQWKWKEIEENKNMEIEAAARSWDELTTNEAEDILTYLVDPSYLLMIGSTQSNDMGVANLRNYNSNIQR